MSEQSYPLPSGRVSAPSTSFRRRRTRRLFLFAGAAGALLLLALTLLALFPGRIAPYDPREMVARPLLAPERAHLLGTNDIGQDLFSELIWGTRASLFTGLVVSLVAVSIGVVIGIYTGFFENWGSLLLLRLIDLTLVLPFLPLVILLSAYLGADQRNVVLILIVVSWAAPARLVRAQVLVLRSLPFVEAARALGSSDGWIMWRHIWPGTRTLALVQVVLVAGTSILAEASLSFLGLGDPATKSWGTMLYFAQVNGVFLSDAWLWWVLPAGLMITLAVFSLVLISYALEQWLETGRRY